MQFELIRTYIKGFVKLMLKLNFDKNWIEFDKGESNTFKENNNFTRYLLWELSLFTIALVACQDSKASPKFLSGKLFEGYSQEKSSLK